jgi:hypothetical protein
VMLCNTLYMYRQLLIMHARSVVNLGRRQRWGLPEAGRSDRSLERASSRTSVTTTPRSSACISEHMAASPRIV